jgi:phosphohistidine phosphatase
VKLYLLRHAKAEDGVNDALRPLCLQGRKSVARLAEFLRSRELLDSVPVWHSRLVRSEETARLLTRAMGWSPRRLKVCDGLEPADSPLSFAPLMEKATKDLLVVGHEPHLGKLASLLLTGHASPVLFKLRKTSLLCLERRVTAGHWQVQWHLGPELFE